MFDDFRTTSTAADRTRMGGSVIAAAAVCGILGAFLLSHSGAKQKIVETLTQVRFVAPPPLPPPPPPPPPVEQPEAPIPVKRARPKAKRPVLKPPTEVPKEKLAESDDALVAEESGGPVDGFLNGVEGGIGTEAVPVNTAPPPPPPPPKPLPITPPIAAGSNVQPKYSERARRKEVEGVVVVVFDVLEDGHVGNVRIVSGPEDLHKNVLEAVTTWRFKPARQGGKPVRRRQRMAIRFQLDNG